MITIMIDAYFLYNLRGFILWIISFFPPVMVDTLSIHNQLDNLTRLTCSLYQYASNVLCIVG